MELAFSDVNPDPRFEAEPVESLDDRVTGADRAGGAVERREEAITSRVALLAAEAAQLPSHERVVLDEQVAPGSVTQLGRAFRRRNQIGEHHRRQDALRDERRFLAGNEPLEFVNNVEREEDVEVVAARNAHRAGGRNTRRHVQRKRRIFRIRAVKDERRHAHGRQHVAEIGLGEMRGGAHTRRPGSCSHVASS